MKQAFLVLAVSPLLASSFEDVDGLSLLQLRSTIKAHSNAGPMDYIGCFKDDGHRDLNQGPKNYGYTSESCKVACAAFTYFALQNGGWCVCDNAYNTGPQYSQVGDNECGNVCNGEAGMEPSRYCGAGWRNAVYGVADAKDDEAGAVADPHMSATGGAHSDLCCEKGECHPCDSSLYGEDRPRPRGRGRGRRGRGRGRGRGRMMGGGMMMGKMGGMMGGMMMGKMGGMMGMMGMMGGNDEAAAVGDPHITTNTGGHYDLEQRHLERPALLEEEKATTEDDEVKGNALQARAVPDGATNIEFVDRGAGPFAEDGVLTGARFYVQRTGNKGLRFRVYRPNGGGFSLVGETEQISMGAAGQVQQVVFAQPVELAAGDYIGWAHDGNGNIPFDGRGGRVSWEYNKNNAIGAARGFGSGGARTYSYEVTTEPKTTTTTTTAPADEAAAEGDPHLTTNTGKKFDLQ